MEDTVTIRMSLLKYYLKCEKKLRGIRDIMETDKFKDFYNEDTSHFQDYMIDIHNKTIPSRMHRRMLSP